MDGGPFRVPQSPERRSTPSRTESTRRPPQARKSELEEEVAPVQRATSSRAAKTAKSPKRFLLPTSIGAALLVFGLAAGWFGSAFLASDGLPSVDTAKYQAVFLTNGQVYFGKLTMGTAKDYIALSDVYYLQGQQQAQNVAEVSEEGDSGSTDVQLIKLGEEIHGPEDKMIVNKDQVLFVENLKSDSTVVRSIQEHKNSQ